MKFLSVQEALDVIPERFTSDGLSGGFPDWIYSKWDLTEIDWPHAHAYCTRCNRAGSMTHRKQEHADARLKAHAKERLPWWLPLTPFILMAGVTIGGHNSFDTCGVEPEGDISDEQAEAGLCRHSMPMPQWMEDLR